MMKELSNNVTDVKLSSLLSDLLQNTKEIKSIIDNPQRKQIFDLVKKDKEMSITDISKKIDLSYRNTFSHIDFLEKHGLVIKEKQEKTRGRMVIAKWTGLKVKDLIEQLIKRINDE